jgi:hypothetical protein
LFPKILPSPAALEAKSLISPRSKCWRKNKRRTRGDLDCLRDGRRPREPSSQRAPPRGGGPPYGVGCLRLLPGRELKRRRWKHEMHWPMVVVMMENCLRPCPRGGIPARARHQWAHRKSNYLNASASAPLPACPTSSASLLGPDATRPLQPWRRTNTVVCHASDGGSSRDNTGRRENTDERGATPLLALCGSFVEVAGAEIVLSAPVKSTCRVVLWDCWIHPKQVSYFWMTWRT